jgi:hypothetical protein
VGPGRLDLPAQPSAAGYAQLEVGALAELGEAASGFARRAGG